MAKLWLDDIRRPPDDTWIWARTLEDARSAIRSHDITEASLDHDLGLHDFDPDEEDADLRRVTRRYKCYVCREECFEKGMNTAPDSCPTCGETDGLSLIEEDDGAMFCRWLVEKDWVPLNVTIHSWNPVGARTMYLILREAENPPWVTVVKPYERAK